MTNTSGIRPINLNVLVLPDPAEEKIGNLWKPETVRDKDQHAQTRGTIVALCDDAFKEMADRPSPGARVTFARYNGSVVKGADGQDYRLLKDIDITGLLA